MERGMVTQRDAVFILKFHRFVSLPNKRLGGTGNTKVCGFSHCDNILNG